MGILIDRRRTIFMFFVSLLLISFIFSVSSFNSFADEGFEDIDKEKIGNAFVTGAMEGSLGAAVGTMLIPGSGTLGGAALGSVIGGTVSAVVEAVREIVTPCENSN